MIRKDWSGEPVSVARGVQNVMRMIRGAFLPAAIAVAAILFLSIITRPLEHAEAHAGDSFKFSSSTYSVTEGGEVTISVQRTTTSGTADGHNVTVEFTDGTAINGTHYGSNVVCASISTTQLVFAASSATQSIIVRTCEDAIDNANRTFTVAISLVTNGGVTGSPSTATVTIIDNDGPQPATITSISPTSGTTAGGTPVTINGSGFAGTPCSGVTFDGIPATSCGVNGSGTQITAATPPHAAGTVPVVVNNGNGPSNSVNYTYLVPGAPFITSVNPASGGIGTVVTITGSNFGTNPAVVFERPDTLQQVAAQVLSVNAAGTQITAVAPTPTTSDRPHHVNVRVIANSMTSPLSAGDDFTYVNISVSSISPSSGPPGITVSIFGTNFSGSPTVKFGTVDATNVQVISSTEIRATVPNPVTSTRPHTVDVIVTIGATSSANTVNDDFTYTSVTVTDVNPDIGPPGTLVTITGTGFTATPIVRFGSVTATVQSFNTTSIVAAAPAQAAGVTTVDVTVQVGLETSQNTAADNYTYQQGVTVTNLEPNKGPISGGNTVVITGSGFLAGATITVSFGGTAATNVTRLSDTQLSVTAPAHAAGVVSVRVTVNGVTSPDGDADNYTYAALPVVTSISPASGPAGGTTIVTIIGLNFTEGAVVKFGTIEAVRTIVSETEIRAVAPSAAPPGTVNVTVTNAAGTSSTGAHTIFTFTGSGGLPVVSSLSPNSAPVNQSGVEVLITGANFATPATVRFGSETSPSVQVLSATQIRAVAPLRATSGVVEVTVTTAAGTSSTAGAGNDFTYGAGSSSGQTTTYQLFARFTLITWDGRNNMPVGDALRGIESPDNPATNNIFSVATAVFTWSDTGAGCANNQPCWLGFFPDGIGVPGANNLLALFRGTAYWVAVSINVTWTVLQGP